MRQYMKYGLVLLSGCIITEVLKQQFKVNAGNVPFFREFCGIWLGPMLTGWSLGVMMTENRKPRPSVSDSNVSA